MKAARTPTTGGIEVTKQILMRPCAERSEEDIRELLPLVKGIKFFKEQGISDVSEFIQIAQCLTYESVAKGRYVFEYGSVGEKFFIIIEGEVSVVIPNPECRDFRHRYEAMIEERRWKVEAAE